MATSTMECNMCGEEIDSDDMIMCGICHCDNCPACRDPDTEECVGGCEKCEGQCGVDHDEEAKCHSCAAPVTGATVKVCGDEAQTGCETWFCATCYTGDGCEFCTCTTCDCERPGPDSNARGHCLKCAPCECDNADCTVVGGTCLEQSAKYESNEKHSCTEDGCDERGSSNEGFMIDKEDDWWCAEHYDTLKNKFKGALQPRDRAK